MVRKIEPYLKVGLSIRKACTQSGVSRTTLYKIMNEESDLANQIEQFQIYLEVMTMSSVTKQLMAIIGKQSHNIELGDRELRFLMWFATNSKYCRDEFEKGGATFSSYDPHYEYMKLVGQIDSYCEEQMLLPTA